MDSYRLNAETERELARLANRFCADIRSGGAPSIEAYAATSPELAELIRDMFPALELLERSGRRYAAGAEGERDSNDHGPPLEASSPDSVSRAMGRLSARGTPPDRYRLEDEIGRGGQGMVLAVWDEDLRRNLAMKVLRVDGRGPGSGPEPRSLGRFLEEAHLTAQLDHPGIVPVHELGLDADSRIYFTMKLVKGRNLGAVFELVLAGVLALT